VNNAELEYLRRIEAEADKEEAAAATINKTAKPSERRRRSSGTQKKRRGSSKSSASMHDHLLEIEDFVRTVAGNKETKKMVRRSFKSSSVGP
jgi:hypothetical protein